MFEVIKKHDTSAWVLWGRSWDLIRTEELVLKFILLIKFEQITIDEAKKVSIAED